MIENNLLTTRQVADLLKVQPRTVHEYRKRGRLHAIRLDGNGPWRFFESSISLFLGVPVKTRSRSKELFDRDRQRAAKAGFVFPS